MAYPIPAEFKEIRIPEQKEFSGVVFPLVLAPAKTLTMEEWRKVLSANEAALKNLGMHHGALLFRGFPTLAAKDFDDFVTALGEKALPYLGGAAPRTNVVGGAFTANEAPPHLAIPYHHELAQNPKYPQRLYFFCEIPPDEGGQTPLVLSHVTFAEMNKQYPEYIAGLRKHGVQYTRTLPNADDKTSTSGRGWQSTWLTHDKVEAEQRAKNYGYTLEWLDDGSMRMTSMILPAVREDPRCGRTIYFNQCGSAHPEFGWKDRLNDPAKAVHLGDEKRTPLDPAAVVGSHKIMNENAVDVNYQKGDIYLCDNFAVLHGRRPYKGNRRILAWLAE